MNLMNLKTQRNPKTQRTLRNSMNLMNLLNPMNPMSLTDLKIPKRLIQMIQRQLIQMSPMILRSLKYPIHLKIPMNPMILPHLMSLQLGIRQPFQLTPNNQMRNPCQGNWMTQMNSKKMVQRIRSNHLILRNPKIQRSLRSQVMSLQRRARLVPMPLQYFQL